MVELKIIGSNLEHLGYSESEKTKEKLDNNFAEIKKITSNLKREFFLSLQSLIQNTPEYRVPLKEAKILTGEELGREQILEDMRKKETLFSFDILSVRLVNRVFEIFSKYKEIINLLSLDIPVRETLDDGGNIYASKIENLESEMSDLSVNNGNVTDLNEKKKENNFKFEISLLKAIQAMSEIQGILSEEVPELIDNMEFSKTAESLRDCLDQIELLLDSVSVQKLVWNSVKSGI